MMIHYLRCGEAFTAHWGNRLCLALLLLISSTLCLQAQKMGKLPGPMTSCPALFEDMHTSHGVPKQAAAFQKSLQANATADIQITYGPGAQGNPEVQEAFRFALDIWANEIVSSVPIRIFADFADLGPGTLASAGPTQVFNNFPNAPVPNVYYNSALANTLANEILDPNEDFDLVVNIGNGINWYFGTDGAPGPGQFDFVTVALHEAGHGLGFISLDQYFDDGTATFEGFGLPFTGIYNTYIVNGDGERLTDLPSPSMELGDQLISNNLFLDGPNTQASFGGESPPIFAPNPYNGGSSISHWNEASFPAGNPNSLMTPQIGSQESNFDLGDITRGLFRDLGWVFSVDDTGPLSVNPGVITEVLPVDTSVTRAIALENSSEEEIMVVAETSTAFISLVGSPDITLAPTSADSFEIEINTTGLPKGPYEGSVDFIVVGGEDTVTVAVVIQVFDGTEAPAIEVDPITYIEVVDQFSTITRDLKILNSGDADLTYSIEVLPADVTGGFAARVERTQAAISKSGFSTQRASYGSRGESLSSAFKQSSGDFNKIVTSLYATDFEDFSPGLLNGQSGWVAQFDDNYVISDENAASGSLHLRAVSDGLGGDRPGPTLALSPSVTQGDEQFMVASADMEISGSGVTWEFIPQSNTAGSVVSRIRFNPDGSIDVLEASIGAFVPIETTTPDGYFNIKVIVDKANANFRLLFDDELIYTGLGFASEIEQIVFLSPMEATGSTLDADNVEIVDGDADAFFLTVNPSMGTVAPGDSALLAVNFSASNLIPGTYLATINVNSNDLDNSTVIIPVTLTVTVPPTISVAPDSLSASVNVMTDDPAIDTETFTITNSGESELTFTTSQGGTTFTSLGDTPEAGSANIDVASLDMRNYGVGNTKSGFYGVEVTSDADMRLQSVEATPTASNTAFIDSIFYDSGSGVATGFVGLDDTSVPISSAIRFDVNDFFVLTALRNYYRTTGEIDPAVILEVYRGGDTPLGGELLTSQTVGGESVDGAFQLEVLNEAQTFEAGESFWVVHKYPSGIDRAQAIDDTGIVRQGANLFSTDAGTTWDNPSDDFIILVRALSDGGDGYITLEPSSGTVAPGESVEVTATFDGSELANGVYETDILVNSNDPLNPVVPVATRFEVSGQVAQVAISDEFILFDNVFIGDEKVKTVTLLNTGLAALNVIDVSSDEEDFTVTPESAVVGAGDTLALTVTFAPSSTGSINGLITVVTDAEENGTLEVVVNGVGVDPPIAVFDPLQVSETVAAGETTEVTVTLSNEGNSPLIYSFPRFAAEAALTAPGFVANNTEFISFAQPAGLTEASFVDDRQGHLVKSSVGTDLFYGYSWIDSDEEGGPVYNYTDISTTGTEVTPDVGISGAIETALPFSFPFYGEEYSDVFIYADGFVAFQEAIGFAFINGQIPETDGVDNIIAAFWDNFNPQSGDGAIYYQALDDRFVVQWTNLVQSLSDSLEQTATFQLALFPDGTIDIYYEDVETYSPLNEATVGIENADATDGAQVAFNTDYIKDGLAVRFLVPDRPRTSFISDVSRLSGVIPAGGSRELTITLDATDLNDGVYFDDLTVSSNSPDASTSTVEFELTVIGTPELSVSPDSIIFGALFVGLEQEASILIRNTGSKGLDLSTITTGTDNFSVLFDSSAATIQPGDSIFATVVFSPTEVGALTDEVIISSSTDGAEDVAVTLLGEGVAPPVIDVTPKSLTVELSEGESTTETITICNTGDATLTYLVAPFTVSNDSMADELRSFGYPRIDYPAIFTKEEADTRKGPSFVNASGGPGTFGYTWVDNNSGGAAYDFIDISGSGTRADVGFDGTELVTLPFAFDFFGEEQTEIIVSANGFLTFEPVTADFGAFLNDQIPNTGNPDNLIAGMWTDLEPEDGGGVFYEGNADRFIVQYEAVPSFSIFDPIAPVTFQIILFPDGSIKMQYANVDSEARTSSTVGLEGPMGQDGLQVIFNAEYLTDELAITFTPPTSGSLEPGECDEVEVTISAESLAAGDYEGEIVVFSNDPQSPETSIPVDLEVIAEPKIDRFVLINADTDEMLGTLEDGDSVDINDFPSGGFNIVAVPGQAEIGSVIFDRNGVEGFATENKTPYAIGGDRGPSDFNSLDFPLGENTVTARPFTGRSGTGEAGIPLTVDFTVFDSSLPQIEELRLANADTDEILDAIQDGDVIDIAQFPSRRFNILAIPGEVLPESVVFDLNGKERFAIENVAPFAIAGNTGLLDFKSLAFPLGTNTVTATAYDGRNGTGTASGSLTVTFEVVNSAVPQVTDFLLVNADTDEIIGSFANGSVVDVAAFPSGGFNIVATLGDNPAGSVVFDLNGNKRNENKAPYAVGGDRGPQNFNSLMFPLGENTISATPYVGRNGTGEEGISLSIAFTVIDSSDDGDASLSKAEVPTEASKSVALDTELSTYPNPVRDVVNFSLGSHMTEGVTVTLMSLTGQVVLNSKQFEISENGTGSFNVGNLARGTYLFVVTDDKGAITARRKLIKQ